MLVGLCLGDDELIGIEYQEPYVNTHTHTLESIKPVGTTPLSSSNQSLGQSLGLSLTIPPVAPTLQRSVSGPGAAASREYEARRQTLAEIISQIRYVLLFYFFC